MCFYKICQLQAILINLQYLNNKKSNDIDKFYIINKIMGSTALGP